MQTLALDLATHTGFALGDQTGIIVSGSRRFPSYGEEIGRFAFAYRSWLKAGLRRHKPEMVVYEQPILGHTALYTARKLYGMAWETELACIDLMKSGDLRPDFVINEVNISDWRTHFLGKGYPRDRNGCKLAVMDMCRVRGFVFEEGNDNEADAIAILDYALACCTPDMAIRATPLFAHEGPRPTAKQTVAEIRAREAGLRRAPNPPAAPIKEARATAAGRKGKK